MESFAERCRALLGEHHREVGEPLDAALERARGAAREAWPALGVPDDRFAARLVQLIGGEPAPLEVLERLHAADLYLSVACADGDPEALAALERDYLPDLRATL